MQILIASGNKNLRTTVSELLREKIETIEAASSVIEAVEKVSWHLPHIIIGDERLLIQIRENLRSILFFNPIHYIAFSEQRGHTSPTVTPLASRLGRSIAYLNIPFESNQLLVQVNSTKTVIRMEKLPFRPVFTNVTFDERIMACSRNNPSWHYLDLELDGFRGFAGQTTELGANAMLQVLAINICRVLDEHGTPDDMAGYIGEGRFGVISHLGSTTELAGILQEEGTRQLKSNNIDLKVSVLH
ncbi:MAG: hypothetical protein L0154_06595 [Chloroflexi bacterium]|nr:hypothetical protein [Chloroflexota bacterium]